MLKIGSTEAGTELNRREANKREKLERIRQAAREIFFSKGFDGATLRQIASAADVAFGTLFLYAKDKQDLLLLLFDEELPLLTERAFLKAKADLPFVDQLVAFFEEFYIFFGKTPQLSRDMMREITFSSGIVSSRIWTGVLDTERHIARLVARAQADGKVSPRIAPESAAHVIFSLYRVEIRFCLSKDSPDVEGSLNKLRQGFELLWSGLEAHP